MAVTVTPVQGGIWIQGLPPSTGFVLVNTTLEPDPHQYSLKPAQSIDQYGEAYIAGGSRLGTEQYVAVWSVDALDSKGVDPAFNERIRYGYTPADRPYLPASAGISVVEGPGQVTAEVEPVRPPSDRYPGLQRYCFESREAMPALAGTLVRAVIKADAGYPGSGRILSPGSGTVEYDAEVQTGQVVTAVQLSTGPARGRHRAELLGFNPNKIIVVQPAGITGIRVIEARAAIRSQSARGSTTRAETQFNFYINVRAANNRNLDGRSIQFVNGGSRGTVTVTLVGSTYQIRTPFYFKSNTFPEIGYVSWYEGSVTWAQVAAKITAHPDLEAYGYSRSARSGAPVTTTDPQQYIKNSFSGYRAAQRGTPRQPLSVAVNRGRIDITALQADSLNQIITLLRGLNQVADAGRTTRRIRNSWLSKFVLCRAGRLFNLCELQGAQWYCSSNSAKRRKSCDLGICYRHSSTSG